LKKEIKLSGVGESSDFLAMLDTFTRKSSAVLGNTVELSAFYDEIFIFLYN